ncbi:MAG TPA: VCBS repeat-containing protein [Gemmataceae bacterium]|nr:VCBS repeat-containing protein [Gemmataceae bacterium]
MIRRLLAFAVLLAAASPTWAYIEAPMTLADVINQSTQITILRVTRVDKSKSLIVYEKVEDIKGKFTTASARHVCTGQLREGETKTVLDWAEPGKTAIFFAKDGACETCIDNYWYQIYKQGDDLYGMSHGEPFLLRSYAGKADRLPPIVRGIMEGREVICPVMEDNKDLLHKRAARIMRTKASMKLMNFDHKRDFLGWGGEDIRRIPGGTGFSHIGPLSRIDAEARHVSAVDFDGDGKLDVCVVSTSAVRLFQNQGESYSEVTLPGFKGGARSAAWGDFNGDGKPDLLLATGDGVKLFTNLGGGLFRDDSARLPRDAAGATAAVWIDADSDGKPDVLVATAFNGLRLFRNNAGKFDDVSTAWGLGPNGIGGDARGEALAVADVNGDRKPDFLYGAGTGMLFVNTGQRFELKSDSGIAFDPTRCGPTFVDFNGDGRVDLFVPQNGKAKLFKNDGMGRFTDVTDKCGDLGKPIFGATSAAWGDFNNDGHLDVVIGCLRGPNRYFQNNGDGTFTDRSAEFGLTARVFNSQAVALADLNGDGKLDLLMANEGQDSAILFGNKELPNKATPLVVHVPADATQVRLVGKDLQKISAISTGDGRGQPGLAPRFVVPPGAYQIEVRDGAGKTLTKDVTATADPMKVRFDEKAAPPAPPKK